MTVDGQQAGQAWMAATFGIGLALILGGAFVGHQDDPRSVAALWGGTLLVAVAGLVAPIARAVNRWRHPAPPPPALKLVAREEFNELTNVVIGRFGRSDRRVAGLERKIAAVEADTTGVLRQIAVEVGEANAAVGQVNDRLS